MAIGPVADDLELHRPYVDAIQIKCPECGKPMTRVTDVIDCWYDSGSMPFAQWHYPFENKEYLREALPGQLHFRSHRPDPRLVLHAGSHFHPAVRPRAL